jgi:heme exporter protein CcmD
MSYLLAAYGFALLVLGGYAVYVARQARAVRARLQEAESEP